MTGKCVHAVLPQMVRLSSSEGIQDPACSVGKPQKKLNLVVPLFSEFSDSALTQKSVVPFVIDPPLLSELRKHVNAVQRCCPKHF